MSTDNTGNQKPATSWYYYDSNGQKQGAFTSGQLKRLAETGQIMPGTMIETESGKTVPANKIQGLKFAVPVDAPLKTTKKNFDNETSAVGGLLASMSETDFNRLASDETLSDVSSSFGFSDNSGISQDNPYFPKPSVPAPPSINTITSGVSNGTFTKTLRQQIGWDLLLDFRFRFFLRACA